MGIPRELDIAGVKATAIARALPTAPQNSPHALRAVVRSMYAVLPRRWLPFHEPDIDMRRQVRFPAYSPSVRTCVLHAVAACLGR